MAARLIEQARHDIQAPLSEPGEVKEHLLTDDVLREAELGDELTWSPRRLVTPDAWAGHVPFAFWLIKAQRPGIFVELGTDTGNSFFAFCQGMAEFTPTGRAFAVDTWQGDEHAGFYDESVFADVQAFNNEHFHSFSTLLRMTFDGARPYFSDGEIDLLHIDGMHTREAVSHDFELWRSALSPRAVAVFHDINVRERNFGVWQYWQDLKEHYPSFEFDHSNGLGVLGVGREQPPSLQALFALRDHPSAAGAVRRRFAARGEAFVRQIEIIDLNARLQQASGRLREVAGLQDLQGHVAELEARLHEMSARAQASTARVEAQQAELAWHASLLDSQHEISRAKGSIIATLTHVSEARAAALAVRDRVIEASDALAAQLVQDLRHQQFLTSEERRVREEMQRGYQDMQRGYEEAIGAINADREALREGLQHAVERAERAEALKEAYAKSFSWRITRPVRSAGSLLKNREGKPKKKYQSSISAMPSPPPIELAPEPAAPVDVTAVTPLKQQFRRLLAARLNAFLSGPHKLRLPRAESPDVSIVLVLYNQAELTFGCLESLCETLAGEAFGVEVVIADNGSTDDTQALLDRLEGATVIRNEVNLHFLKGVNQATSGVRGRTILLLNNDAQLLPGSLVSALRTLDSDQRIAAVGGRIILPDGTLQEAGSIIWRDGACTGYARGHDPDTPEVMFQRDVNYCSGAFLLVRTEIFCKLKGFDERYAPAYYEETDFCVRLAKDGYRVVYDPDAVIVHYEFGSSTASGDALRLQHTNRDLFFAQHRDWLEGQFPASPLNVLAARTVPFSAPRILVLEDRVPKIGLGSGYPRSNRLLHELVAAGAQVTLFPMFRHHETWHDVRQALDKRIEVLIKAERSELRGYLVARPQQFDAVLICRPHNMAAFQEAIGPERNLLGGAAVLYDAEALFVTRELQRRAAEGDEASDLEHHKLVASEVALTRLATETISVSVAEQQTFQDYGVRETHLLGHAIDDEPLPLGLEHRMQIVFLGAIHDEGAPNADAVRWFANAILPLLRRALDDPDLRLRVIGLSEAASIKAMDGDRLDLAGMVDDVPGALAHARIMVVPTRFAAGIPHKAHQAAMLGIPMVTTTLIAEQLGWEHGTHLLVADDPKDFAAACTRLYRDKALWETVRRNALSRARQDCSPERFRAKVQELVAGLPLVHRRPEHRREPERQRSIGSVPPTEYEISRPLAADWSMAVPFSYRPPDRSPPRIGVICHLFHAEIAPEVLFYLKHLPLPADLFISTDSSAKQLALSETFKGWSSGAVEVRVTPNRGRDIAPKLIGFAEVYDRYDLVLHLHSKRSDHAPFLAPWRSYLFETLLGSPEVVRSILEAFAHLPDLGMVAPQHYEAVRRWLGWNGNFETARVLAEKMGIKLSPKRTLDLPSGSMFWARPEALRPLLDLQLTFDDFPSESAQLDHTPAHAIERLYFYSCERSGHTWLKVAQPALCFDSATIAEIGSPTDLSRFAVEKAVVLSGLDPIPARPDRAPIVTRVPPGLAERLAKRRI